MSGEVEDVRALLAAGRELLEHGGERAAWLDGKADLLDRIAEDPDTLADAVVARECATQARARAEALRGERP